MSVSFVLLLVVSCWLLVSLKMFSFHKLKKIWRKYREKNIGSEIYPDEIFLDSSNLPEFDQFQFEGRLEKPIAKKTVYLLGASLFIFALLFLGKIWALQINQGEDFKAKSENNRLRHAVIFAERGVIYDRNKVLLASNELNEKDPDFSKRKYADMEGLAHTLGYVKYPSKDSAGFYYKEDYTGIDGVEKVYNEALTGANGLRMIETDAYGNVQSNSVIEPPRHGQSLTLSIDSRVQNTLYEKIKETVNSNGFKGGAGVIMDVNTGEILALTNYPEYSSQALSDGVQIEINKYLKSDMTPFLNRATEGLYTPGSIVKPIIALGALDKKIIDPMKQILSTGSISIPNPYDPEKFSIFKDWRVNGWMDMRHAIAFSCNIYFYEVGGGFEDQKGLGITNIDNYAKMFGLGTPTNVDLPRESNGIVPSPLWKRETFSGDDWRVGDTYNTAIGQYGFQVTPLQMARVAAAVANYGKLLTPTILSREIYDANKNPEQIPIAKENFDVVKEGMRLTVTESSAGELNIPGLKVAAKTGTAQVGAKNQYINAWVIGFFPYDKPKYSFAILMERSPSTNLVGSVHVMGEVLRWMASSTPEYLK